ncbi:MAG: YIP1 family protein [Candidatus Andersenbacteria bacterium]
MNFLKTPVQSFRELKKNALVTDSLFVVGSIWIVLLGLQLSRLANHDALTTVLIVRSIAEITFWIIAIWLTVSGLAYLLTQSSGAKANFNAILVMSGLAAIPLAFAGIIAILVQLLALMSFAPENAVFWATRLLLVVALLLGTPGLYFALGLHAITGVRKSVAIVISVFLSIATILILLLQGSEALQF